MVLLEKLWDDIVAGPQPEYGLGKLRKLNANLSMPKDSEGEGSSSKYQRSLSMPGTPGTVTGTPAAFLTPGPRKENVWRSVFHPGSNLATKTVGANLFDKPQANSPTVYDWLYCGETRRQHR